MTQTSPVIRLRKDSIISVQFCLEGEHGYAIVSCKIMDMTESKDKILVQKLGICYVGIALRYEDLGKTLKDKVKALYYVPRHSKIGFANMKRVRTGVESFTDAAHYLNWFDIVETV